MAVVGRMTLGVQMYNPPEVHFKDINIVGGYNGLRRCPCIRVRRHIHYLRTTSISDSITLYPYYILQIAADAHSL